MIGKGHKSKAATPESRRSIFVCTKPLDPSLLAHGLTTFDLKTTSECEHTFPVTRVVDTEDGGSKFLDVVVELDQRPIPNNYMSVVFPACDVIFAERTKDSDFHVGCSSGRASELKARMRGWIEFARLELKRAASPRIDQTCQMELRRASITTLSRAHLRGSFQGRCRASLQY